MGERTFLHAADIHLDSPMLGLSRYAEAPEELFRNAPRRALINLVDLALDKRVSAVVIAGDLFDGDWRSAETGLFFIAQMARLAEAGIPVAVLSGNHDAASKMTHSLKWPDNVSLFPHKKPGTFLFEESGLALHGQSFERPAVTTDLTASYPSRAPGLINVGVLHTGLEGQSRHAHYAPCTLEGLRTFGYDYWALGHIHDHQVLSSDPYVVYPGNIQGRSVRECGQKGVVLVRYDEDGIQDIEFESTSVATWAVCNVDVSGLDNLESVYDEIEQAYHDLAADHADDHPIAVRTILTGVSRLAGQLEERQGRVRDNLVARVLGSRLDNLWLEKLQVEVLPSRSLGELKARQDALGALASYFEAGMTDSDVLNAVSATMSKLKAKLDADVIDLVEFPWDEDGARQLLSHAAPILGQITQDNADHAELLDGGSDAHQ